MARDPIYALAMQRIVAASAELEVQLSGDAAAGPTVHILKVLKARAAKVMTAICFLNIDDPQDRLKYIAYQNDIKRYDEWFKSMGDLIAEGVRIDKEQTAEEREELTDYLVNTGQAREAVELGLIDDVATVD